MTSTVPTPEGAVAVRRVWERTLTLVAAMEPKRTVVPATNALPSMVTTVPPGAGPWAGVMVAIVGRGTTTE